MKEIKTLVSHAIAPGGVGKIFLVVTSVQPFSHWPVVTVQYHTRNSIIQSHRRLASS